MKSVLFFRAVSVGFLFTIGVVARGESAAAGNLPLDYAFRFASALGAHDATDGGRAQAKVVVDYLNAGLVDEAITRADQIVNWRRGAAYAEIATVLGSTGRTNETLQFIQKAEKAEELIDPDHNGGFEKDRIAAHVALARLAMSTNDAQVAEMAGLLPLEEQVTLRSRLVSQMQPTNFEDAMANLGATLPPQETDVRADTTNSYRALAQSGAVGTNAERRTQMIKALQDSVRGQPLAMRAPYLERAANVLAAAGDRAGAHEILDDLVQAVRRAPTIEYQPPPATRTNETGQVVFSKKKKYRPAAPGGDVLAPILADVAVGFHRLGETDHALELLQEAEALKPNTADLIDALQPRLAIGAAYVEIGRLAEGRKAYNAALEEAAGFGNARPRSLALVEFCRSIGQHRLELNEVWRKRLDELLAGLRDPW